MLSKTELSRDLDYVSQELKYYEELNATNPDRRLSALIRDLRTKKGLLEHQLSEE